MAKIELKNRIRTLEEQLSIQMDNNKILNKRNQKLQQEVIKYQKDIQEGKEIIKDLLKKSK